MEHFFKSHYHKFVPVGPIGKSYILLVSNETVLPKYWPFHNTTTFSKISLNLMRIYSRTPYYEVKQSFVLNTSLVKKYFKQ